MADNCKDLVRLFIEGYADEPNRYMVKWVATPLQSSVKLGSYEFIVKSQDGAIDWYTNGTWIGGTSTEVKGEQSTPDFRVGMVLDVSPAVSIQGTSDAGD